jgi:hypothetical protein
MRNRSPGVFRRFAGNFIKLRNLFGSVFAANTIVRIVGKNNTDDVFFQGFFVSLGFEGLESGLLFVPPMPPSEDGADTETDLRSDLMVVVFMGGEQNDLNTANEVLR